MAAECEHGYLERMCTICHPELNQGHLVPRRRLLDFEEAKLPNAERHYHSDTPTAEEVADIAAWQHDDREQRKREGR